MTVNELLRHISLGNQFRQLQINTSVCSRMSLQMRMLLYDFITRNNFLNRKLNVGPTKSYTKYYQLIRQKLLR